MNLASLKTKFLASLVFAVLVLLVLAFYADAQQLAAVLARFEWGLLPLILLLTLTNYGLRFVKWHYYLGQIGVRSLPWPHSMALFFAGLSMVVTPGKLGEWLKSYLLREMTGTPFFRSAPIILAERLTDGLAMVLLGAGGLALTGIGWQVMAFVVAVAAVPVAVVWSPALATLLLALAARLPLVGSRAAHLQEFYEASRAILSPRNVLLGVGIGVVSWGAECVAYYLVLVGLGQPAAGEVLLHAAFILAAASLGGSIMMTPGGLGVAEGGLTGLAQYLLGMGAAEATASAILIRMSTLWFGVVVGFAGLACASRLLAAKRPEGRSSASSPPAD